MYSCAQNSYCVGDVGRIGKVESAQTDLETDLKEREDAPPTNDTAKAESESSSSSSSSDSSSEVILFLAIAIILTILHLM